MLLQREDVNNHGDDLAAVALPQHDKGLPPDAVAVGDP